MRKAFFPLWIASLSIGISSCSSTNSDKNEGDTSVVTAVIEKRAIQTDSGKIEIETVKGNVEGKATLLDANGKVIGRGMMNGDKPVGAWLKYDKDGNLISAEHYSEGKAFQKLDVKDFDFNWVENKKIGAKFKVPKNWKEKSSPNQALVVAYLKDVTDTSIHVQPNFTVVKGRLQKGENLQTIAKMQMDMMHENYDRVTPVQENNIIIDSCLAFQRYGTYDFDNNEVGFLNVIVVSGQDLWIISCEAQNRSQGEFLKYQGVFQEITESFQRIK